MQQRKSATAGRPSGTDGSDFSYRMLVDPRYTKVAQGKSRLRLLLMAQAVSLIIGVLWIVLSTFPAMENCELPVASVIIGLVSVNVGFLGRRKSSVNLLRLYVVASSISTVLSLASHLKSGFSFKAIQDQSAFTLKKFEVLEVGRILLGLPLQVIVVIVTFSLIGNMSPPKRAS